MQRLLLTALAALALTLAACGGGDEAEAAEPIIVVDGTQPAETSTAGPETTEEPNSESASLSGDAITDEERALAFADCLRDEGLDVNDPTVDADGTVSLRSLFGDGPAEIREENQGAFDACGDFLEGGNFGPGGGEFDPTEIQDQLVEFASCLRDQGLDVKDPDISGGLAGARGPENLFGLDIREPQYEDQVDACDDILAFGPGGRGR